MCTWPWWAFFNSTSHCPYLRKEDQHVRLSTSRTALRPRLGSKHLEMYHKLSCEHRILVGIVTSLLLRMGLKRHGIAVSSWVPPLHSCPKKLMGYTSGLRHSLCCHILSVSPLSLESAEHFVTNQAGKNPWQRISLYPTPLLGLLPSHQHKGLFVLFCLLQHEVCCT